MLHNTSYFCPRETRQWKIKIFSEETTSALAGFHVGPLSPGDVGFCGGRKSKGLKEKPSEQGKNQQQTHCTGIEPRPHWWEVSPVATAQSLLPTHPSDLIWIPSLLYTSSSEHISVGHRMHCKVCAVWCVISIVYAEDIYSPHLIQYCTIDSSQ